MLEIDWYTSSWFLGTYVLGTYLGYRFANRKAMDIIAHTIESLRKGGYIKVKYSGVGDQDYELERIDSDGDR